MMKGQGDENMCFVEGIQDQPSACFVEDSGSKVVRAVEGSLERSVVTFPLRGSLLGC